MRLAIVTNKPYDKSETFIKAIFDFLPFEKYFFHGTKHPLTLNNQSVNLWSIKYRILRKLFPNYEIGLGITKKLLKQNKIEMVMAEYGMTGALMLPVCQQLNIPLIVHFHGHDAVRKTIINPYRDSYRQMFNYASKIIAVSNEMSKRLIKIGCPKEKIEIIPCGPNDIFMDVKPKFTKKQFIAIGRFVEKKAPHLLILAFNQVLKDNPEAKLIFAGDGILLDSSKDLVIALGIEKNVIFPGRISPDEYRKYLSESMAFVQHSVEAQDGDMEGTPVAVLEAGAAGLPVISTYHAGIPDVVIYGETGLLSNERDIKTMANNMNWILGHRNETIVMGKKAKKRIMENYSMNIHIKKLSDTIKSVL